ncbi:hypothetical protein JA1_000286 [Spathaspora sp. JA1]|nr:hypothetical protein JA1_000286 [Spathaspora sp. JA1]
MYIITSKYYTPLDRFINKFKKKGFLLYSGIILLSVGYVMYELSHLPQIPPERKKKLNLDKEIKSNSPDKDELSIDHSHEINSWSKKQLFEYLHKQNIYPDIDEKITTIRRMVYEIYERQTNI